MDKQGQHYQCLGEHFGYPACCIVFFKSQEHMTTHLSLYEELMPKSGAYRTGYIPCLNHLRLLCNNKVTIQQLLKERKCETPFPFHRNRTYTCAECVIRRKQFFKDKEAREHSLLSKKKDLKSNL
jgi:hypothetical protein